MTPDPVFRPIQNRNPLTLADLAGYRFVTPGGNGYGIDDLASDWIAIESLGEFSHLSPRVAAGWLNADFRICLPKLRTDPDSGYKLALASLVDLLSFDPVVPGASFVEPRDKIAWVIRRVPPQFVILDALSSCLGDDGTLRPVTSPTMTIIAGEDPILVDWVASSKAGRLATSSPLMQAALKARDPRGAFTIVGDIVPFDTSRVDGQPTARDLPVYEERFGLLARLLASDLDFELFPPESLVLADLAGRRQRLLASGPTSNLAAVLPAIGRWCDRALFLYARYLEPGRLARRHFGLNVSEDRIGEKELDCLRSQARSLRGRLQAVAKNLEFEQVDTTPENDFVAVCTRNLAIDYDDFLLQFDIARSMKYLSGYVGGSSIALAFDERERVVLQLERTVYLSQPAFLSWFGNDTFDVTKIEEFERTDDLQTISWHTLASENQSARADDGVLSVKRQADGSLRLEIAVHQRFEVPAALQFMESIPFGAVRMDLARQTYQTFFRNTIANFEAVYEGRDPLLGRWPDSPRSHADSNGLDQIVERGVQWLTQAARTVSDRARTAATRPIVGGEQGADYQEEVDERGFRHFRVAEALSR